MCVCMREILRVCVCVCVCERESEREEEKTEQGGNRVDEKGIVGNASSQIPHFCEEQSNQVLMLDFV